MFIQNKYTKLYFNIVTQSETDLNTYSETHHIIPRSMGGSDEPSNLVRLSARKHFICHYLLIKMIEPKTSNWYKMVKAFGMMMATPAIHKRYMNSRLFESQRINAALAQSVCQSGIKNSQYGTKWIHKGTYNLRIKSHELDQYLSEGYLPGQYKKPKIKPPSKRDLYHNQEREILLPFLDRFLKGESLRIIANDYGKSHVSLHLRLKFHFNDQLVNIKQGSLKR